MKLIGLLGGINGWKTTATYYRLINEYAHKQLGDDNTARVLLHSVNFQQIKECYANNDWATIGSVLAEAGNSLKAGGADFIVMTTNSMHHIADRVSAEVGLDILHIADPAGGELASKGYRKVGLLGTRATMESDIYSDRLLRSYGISVIVPNSDDRAELDRIIYDELNIGVVRTGLQTYIWDQIRNLRDRGAEAIILGCTEITMFAPPQSNLIPAYDTSRLHAMAAVRRSMGKVHV